MTEKIFIGDIPVQLSWKKVKNLNLRVRPPKGEVFLSVPLGYSQRDAEAFLLSKEDWIKRSIKKLSESHVAEPDFTDGEVHYFLGKPYKLRVKEALRNRLETQADFMILYLREDSPDRRKKLVEDFYRQELRTLAWQLVPGWEKKMGVKLWELGIRKMKTRWGSCNITKARVWLSLELAKYPLEAIEYVLVHELVHLLERGHNKRFYGFMDYYLPDWKSRKKLLDAR